MQAHTHLEEVDTPVSIRNHMVVEQPLATKKDILEWEWQLKVPRQYQTEDSVAWQKSQIENVNTSMQEEVYQ